MEISNIDASFVVGACVGITQKHGTMSKEKFGLVMWDLAALEGGYITANRPTSADAVSKFRTGWQLAFPEEWRA